MSSSRGRPTGASQDSPPGSTAYGQAPGYGGVPEPRYAAEQTGGGAAAWTGAVLAGVLMIVGGLFGFLAGLGAVIKGGFFVYHANYAYTWSTRGWGWVELILGAVVFAAGFSVILGMTWARVVGVILASLSAIANFLWLPFYPIWGIIAIAVDLFIIWALLRHERVPTV